LKIVSKNEQYHQDFVASPRDKRQIKEFRKSDRVGLSKTEAGIYAKAVFPTAEQEEAFAHMWEEVELFSRRKDRPARRQHSEYGLEQLERFRQLVLKDNGVEKAEKELIRTVGENRKRLTDDDINSLFQTLMVYYRREGKRSVRDSRTKKMFRDKSIALYRQMFRHFCLPNAHMYKELMLLSIAHGEYEKCVSLHEEMKSTGIKDSQEIAAVLVRAAASAPLTRTSATYGDRRTAQKVVQTTERLFLESFMDDSFYPNTDVCNSLMHAYSRVGDVHKAFELMNAMETHGIPPNHVTFTQLMKVHAAAISAPKVERDRLRSERSRLERLRHRSLASPRLDWMFLQLEMYPASGVSGPAELLHETLAGEHDEAGPALLDSGLEGEEATDFSEEEDAVVTEPLALEGGAEEEQPALVNRDLLTEKIIDMSVELPPPTDGEVEVEEGEGGLVSAQDAMMMETYELDDPDVDEAEVVPMDQFLHHDGDSIDVEMSDEEMKRRAGQNALVSHAEDIGLAKDLESLTDFRMLSDQYDVEDLIRSAEDVHRRVIERRDWFHNGTFPVGYLDSFLAVYATGGRLNRAQSLFETYRDDYGQEPGATTYDIMMRMYSKSRRLGHVEAVFEEAKRSKNIRKDNHLLNNSMLSNCLYNNDFRGVLNMLKEMNKDNISVRDSTIRSTRKKLQKTKRLAYKSGKPVGKLMKQEILKNLPSSRPLELEEEQKKILRRNKLHGIKKKTRKRLQTTRRR
jgi:pentatricopeptide repeat protein